MSVSGRKQTLDEPPFGVVFLFKGTAANDCGFNRSMQHLISKYREEDVDHEVSTKNLLHRRTEVVDVGSLAKRRLSAPDRPVI